MRTSIRTGIEGTIGRRRRGLKMFAGATGVYKGFPST